MPTLFPYLLLWGFSCFQILPFGSIIQKAIKNRLCKHKSEYTKTRANAWRAKKEKNGLTIYSQTSSSLSKIEKKAEQKSVCLVKWKINNGIIFAMDSHTGWDSTSRPSNQKKETLRFHVFIASHYSRRSFFFDAPQ